MPKRSSKKSKRRSKTLPALGLAGVSFSLASGACASTSEAAANAPSAPQSQGLLLGEEEIFDVSLATFYVYDKENDGPSALVRKLRLARGGCGGCGGCHGCGGGGGCHMGCGGGGCRCGGGIGGCGGGIHIGCGGGCHVGCRGCRCGGGFFFGGCVGCTGCGGCGGGSCWVWTPTWGWVYSCVGGSTPPSEASPVVASEQSPQNKQSAQTAKAAAKGDEKIAGTRTD
jgi:hypothetical protein